MGSCHVVRRYEGVRLIPDKLEEAPEARSRFGALGVTVIAFFLVEIGQSQLAT